MKEPGIADLVSDPAEEILFEKALEIPAVEAREQFLERACGQDSGLKERVAALLGDYRRADEWFASGDAALERSARRLRITQASATAEIGTQIGAYRLIRRLGEGGAGVVYQARQDVPVHRMVALKILKLGMDTDRVIARFEAERQTLALMEHSNIARVFDAGATDTGRPYFVMELVHGARITEYCEQAGLSLADRLRLFQQVASAVQHAHQKGIIHRDLKPSNILVAEVDGLPVPKIIDFGIAKAAAAPVEGGMTLTLHDQPIGTPAYMSPEQFQGGDVDTRSDVYSLGVVLYELLAGLAPFDNDDLLRAGVDAMRHRVGREEPPRPSVRRGRWAPQLRGELDWIVMKALEKDRERRYQTVRGLSEDIERYLANEPVSARPPSRLYRFRKLVQRNTLAFAAITVAFLALATGFTTSTWLLLRARAAERQQAQMRAESEERERITKAAILIMQNRTSEAEAEIRRMGGMLTQPSVEATGVFRQLAAWNALRRDWKSASQRLLALNRVNRFDDADLSDNATRDFVPLAPALIASGDLRAYRDFCQQLLDRLGGTTNPVAAEQILKSCLLLPQDSLGLARLAPAAAVAEKSLAAKKFVVSTWLDAWRSNALGLWNYRNGNAAAAVQWTTRALTLEDDEQSRRAFSLAVRGLAEAKLGLAVQAQSDFTQARALVEQTFSRPLGFNKQGYWHDWLASRLLLEEAGFAMGN